MIRMLLTTTALTAMLSGAALAQTTPANTMEAPANAMTTTAAPADRPMVDIATGYTYADSDNLASRIIGSPVYSGPADDAEQIGDITDLVLDMNGDVNAVIIGVGGFLGIGQKQVAVDFGALEMVIAADQTERFVVPTTREALEAAPEFEWVEDDVVPAGDATAPVAPGAPMTTAPAAPVTAPAAPMTPAPAPMAPAATPAPAPMAPANNTMAPANTTSEVAPLDRSTLTEFDELTLTADELEGTAVYGPGDERVGTISDVVLSESGEVDAVIVDVGGFLGIGAKPVAIGFDDLNFQVDANNNRYLLTEWTAEQLEAQPEFDEDTYAAERDSQRLVRM
ncbi:PRC-barrel domain-containing protein [Devosia enhydra]|uniref:PRC-barrel domain-containing protein n=1 Tax=Devosia enhydra TaxID=665118 RepID=A0A1K2HWS8_9HYPH|nr:PRC-barrel domain-containing protein [Devosia enhydra]SFZ83509.1 PRC-barrel domain-containing protein [Devosia enhydra]